MTNRKQLIDVILNNFYAMRHQMKPKCPNSENQKKITHSQWFVLGIIANNKKVNIKEISEKLGMSSSGVTQLVDGLVQSGYVTRQIDTSDRRSVQLELSVKSAKQLAAMKEKRINEMAKLFEVLTDKELETYARLHSKVMLNFLSEC